MLYSDLRHSLDPVLFAVEALGFHPDAWQANVLRWNGKRLLLNCCRQSGKSSTAAILGLHKALYCPGSLILLVSPSLRQSSELFRKVTDFLSKLEQQPLLKEDNKLSLTLDNNSRIVSLPSTEQTVRGFSGASLIIEDESARVQDELYYAIRPMLAVSGGRLILMSTPFGKRGHFFHEFTFTEGRDTWERIVITAHDCPRISPDFIAEERKAMPDFFFRAEYMCEFTETIDQVFSYEHVQGSLDDTIEPLIF